MGSYRASHWQSQVFQNSVFCLITWMLSLATNTFSVFPWSYSSLHWFLRWCLPDSVSCGRVVQWEEELVLLEIRIITQVFFLRTIMLLQYRTDVLYAHLPVRHILLKRSVLKGQDLIKSMFFIFSTWVLLSETVFHCKEAVKNTVTLVYNLVLLL